MGRSLITFRFRGHSCSQGHVGDSRLTFRYPTFSAPEPSKYDELFVVKSIEAFHQALTFINSYNSTKLRNRCCSPSQEGVKISSQHHIANSSQHSPVGGDEKFAQSSNQLNHVMQIGCLNSLTKEGVGLCSKILTNQKPV